VTAGREKESCAAESFTVEKRSRVRGQPGFEYLAPLRLISPLSHVNHIVHTKSLSSI
jgi:hypothetical protein